MSIRHGWLGGRAMLLAAVIVTLAWIAITQGDPPDLVLMDCQMPVMSEFEATARIREWEAENGLARLPIVALTAGAFDDDRERCLAVGMDDFVTKPIDFVALPAVVARWLKAAGPSSQA